jgi:hypothetical protein
MLGNVAPWQYLPQGRDGSQLWQQMNLSLDCPPQWWYGSWEASFSTIAVAENCCRNMPRLSKNLVSNWKYNSVGHFWRLRTIRPSTSSWHAIKFFRKLRREILALPGRDYGFRLIVPKAV